MSVIFCLPSLVWRISIPLFSSLSEKWGLFGAADNEGIFQHALSHLNRSPFWYSWSKQNLARPESESEIILLDKVYEVLGWLVSVFLPALAVFFATLVKAWEWNLPTEAILTTVSAVELLLGTIFGIPKVT